MSTPRTVRKPRKPPCLPVRFRNAIQYELACTAAAIEADGATELVASQKNCAQLHFQVGILHECDEYIEAFEQLRHRQTLLESNRDQLTETLRQLIAYESYSTATLEPKECQMPHCEAPATMTAPCEHVLCRACWVGQARHQLRCPLCRGPINEPAARYRRRLKEALRRVNRCLKTMCHAPTPEQQQAYEQAQRIREFIVLAPGLRRNVTSRTGLS